MTHPTRQEDDAAGEELRLLVVADDEARAGYRGALAEIGGLRLLEVASGLDALEVILAGAADLWHQLLFLGTMAIAGIAYAVRRFRMSIA